MGSGTVSAGTKLEQNDPSVAGAGAVTTNCKPASVVPSQHLLLQNTDRIRALLHDALTCQSLHEDKRESIQQVLRGEGEGGGAEGVPYSLVRDVCHAVRHERGSEGPWLHHVLRKSGLWLPAPKPRVKSAELRLRLTALQDAVDRKEYADLVADVTVAERRESGRTFMGSYSEQFGFGLHVLVVMFTMYCFGHYIMATQFPHQPFMHAVGGVVGLIVGMLVEVFLFIIRAVRHEEEEDGKKQSHSGSSQKGSSKEVPSAVLIAEQLKKGPKTGDTWRRTDDSSVRDVVSVDSEGSGVSVGGRQGDKEEEGVVSDRQSEFELSLRRSKLGVRKRIVK